MADARPLSKLLVHHNRLKDKFKIDKKTQQKYLVPINKILVVFISNNFVYSVFTKTWIVSHFLQETHLSATSVTGTNRNLFTTVLY